MHTGVNAAGDRQGRAHQTVSNLWRAKGKARTHTHTQEKSGEISVRVRGVPHDVHVNAYAIPRRISTSLKISWKAVVTATVSADASGAGCCATSLASAGESGVDEADDSGLDACAAAGDGPVRAPSACLTSL